MSPRAQEWDLRKSSSKIGPLYEVLRDANGRVIDGFHRLEVDPDWPSRILPDVVTEEQRLMVSVHSNLARRRPSREETKSMVNRIAEFYLSQGCEVRKKETVTREDPRIGQVQQEVMRNEVFERTAEFFEGVLKPMTVKQYMAGEFKQMERAHRGKSKSEPRDFMERMGAWAALRQFYGPQLRETFGVNFMKALKNDMEKRVLKDPSILRRIRSELRLQLMAEVREELSPVFQLNAMNLVEFYLEELTLIKDGEDPHTVLEPRDRTMLVKYRLLDRNLGPTLGREYSITDAALQQLEILEEEGRLRTPSERSLAILNEGRLATAKPAQPG